MGKGNQIVMLAKSETVVIPRTEYESLLRRSTLLDVILEYSSKDGSWKLTETVEMVHKILCGGDREDA